MPLHTFGDLIGTKEASRILDVDKATITRWVQTGHLTAAHKLPGPNGLYLFHRADIETLAKQRAAS